MVLVGNDVVLSTVAALTQAFDRMEDAEFTAGSVLFGATALEDIDRQSGLV